MKFFVIFDDIYNRGELWLKSQKQAERLEAYKLIEPSDNLFGRPTPTFNCPVGQMSTPSLSDLKRNIDKYINAWQKMIFEDIKAGKSKEQYRTTRIFRNMPKNIIKEVCKYLKSGFTFELLYPSLEFTYMKTKIGKPKDGGFPSTNKYNDCEYSPDYLTLLVYSFPGANPRETAKLTYPAMFGIETSPGGSPDIPVHVDVKSKTITIGQPGQYIRFSIHLPIADAKNIVNTETMLKLKNIYRMVNKLNNLLIPDRPIELIVLYTKQEGEECDFIGTGGMYNRFQHYMHFTDDVLEASHYLFPVAHEMGHAVFTVRFGGDQDDFEFFHGRDSQMHDLYASSLVDRKFEMGDDSNYLSVSDRTGHPFDAASELFASFFAVYLLASDKFVENIQNRTTSKEMSLFGKKMFCFLRDRVFCGEYFSKNDPSKGDTLECLTGPRQNDAYVNDLIAASKKDPNLGKYANEFMLNKYSYDEKMQNVVGLIQDRSFYYDLFNLYPHKTVSEMLASELREGYWDNLWTRNQMEKLIDDSMFQRPLLAFNVYDKARHPDTMNLEWNLAYIRNQVTF